MRDHSRDQRPRKVSNQSEGDAGRHLKRQMCDRNAMIKVSDPEHYPYDENGRYDATSFLQGSLHIPAKRKLFGHSCDRVLPERASVGCRPTQK